VPCVGANGRVPERPHARLPSPSIGASGSRGPAERERKQARHRRERPISKTRCADTDADVDRMSTDGRYGSYLDLVYRTGAELTEIVAYPKGRPVVADHTSDDHPAAPTNGAIKAEEKSGLLADAVAREDEQTRSDQDQTRSDADQTGSDSDQTTADTDEAASESDQAASDRVRAEGGDPAVLDVARNLRDRGSLQREQSARTRLASADARDQVAHERDLAAVVRDRAALLRDTAALAAEDKPGGQIALRAVENRKRAATDRIAASEGRARAAADRAQAALDREDAARDRAETEAERAALLED
jgi:hypothetical protein